MNHGMDPNKALWEKGDFTRIAARMRESGESLVARLGVDIASNLVEAGNRHAQAEGLPNCRIQEGNATSSRTQKGKHSEVLALSVAGVGLEPTTPALWV